MNKQTAHRLSPLPVSNTWPEGSLDHLNPPLAESKWWPAKRPRSLDYGVTQRHNKIPKQKANSWG